MGEQCSEVEKSKAVDGLGSIDVSGCVNEGGKCFVELADMLEVG